MKALVVASIIAVLASGSVQPQASAPIRVSGRIVGVYDDQSGEPLEGVEIRNLFNGWSVLTTATGTALLSFVDTTGAILSLKKVGYNPLTTVVKNSPQDTTPVTLVLKRITQVLPAVVTRAKGDSAISYISPALRGFEERRQKGFGHFISEAELRKKDNSPMSEVLVSHLPGVKDRLGQVYGARSGPVRPGDRELCFLTVYWDGVLYYSRRNGGPPPDFGRIATMQFAGVEFYPGGATIPVQYNASDSGCGTLLLWTRER
jgi:hypothetical protein